MRIRHDNPVFTHTIAAWGNLVSIFLKGEGELEERGASNNDRGR